MSAKLELSPATRAATASAVDDIAAVLAHPPPPDDGDELLALSVFGYDAGYALFYAYLDRVQPRAQWKRLGNRHLARAIARVPDASDRPFFAYGFSGTGWAVQHLAGWFVNVDDDTLSDVDDVLTMLVEQAPTVSLDLQHGLVGFGLYALERLPTASARRLLEAVIDRLGAAAERVPAGLRWQYVNAVWVEGRAKQARERGLYLAGVYNGAAGICGLLGASIDAGVEVERARALLEPALRALLERSVANEDPAAWHDGTLGIAAVAFVAARAAGLDHWQERALAIASRVARAAPRTRDASIFWGAAGAAHMFYRLYDATGQEVFADATRRYLASLLRRRRSNESGLAGFRTYRYAWERDFLGKPDYPVGWIGRPGILQGVAGIGLVLLAILHADEPAWDRCLLLSHRAS